MTNEERCEAFRELIERVSAFAARNFPDVDRKDVEQELYILVLTNKKIPTPEVSGGNAATVLYFAAKRAARVQRAGHLYTTSQYSYTLDDLKRLLEDNFDREAWAGGWVPEDARSESGSDDLNMRADVAWAYDLLQQTYKEAIFKRYALREIPPSASTEGRLLRRAIDKLHDLLNSFSRGLTDGPGTRKVLSNAASNHRISNQ